MKHDKQTPIYEQAKKLAEKQELNEQQMEEWIHLLKTSYIVGGDSILSKPELSPIVPTELRIFEKSEEFKDAIGINLFAAGAMWMKTMLLGKTN